MSHTWPREAGEISRSFKDKIIRFMSVYAFKIEICRITAYITFTLHWIIILPWRSANALTIGFCCCSSLALSKSNISNEDDGNPPEREDISEWFAGLDDGAANCPKSTGDGELDRGPEGDVIGFTPDEPRVSPFGVGSFLSCLKLMIMRYVYK